MSLEGGELCGCVLDLPKLEIEEFNVLLITLCNQANQVVVVVADVSWCTLAIFSGQQRIGNIKPLADGGKVFSKIFISADEIYPNGTINVCDVVKLVFQGVQSVFYKPMKAGVFRNAVTFHLFVIIHHIDIPREHSSPAISDERELVVGL